MVYTLSAVVGVRRTLSATRQERLLRPCTQMASIDISLATGDVMGIGQTRPVARSRSQIGHGPLSGRLVWRLAAVAALATLARHMRQTKVGPALIIGPT